MVGQISKTLSSMTLANGSILMEMDLAIIQAALHLMPVHTTLEIRRKVTKWGA